MGAMIELPQITGGNEREQLRYIQRYLYRMAQQLNVALDAAEGSMLRVMETGKNRQGGTVPGEEKSPKATFNSIKSLIIKSADIVNAYYEEINRQLEGQYVAQSDFGTYRQETSQKIQETADGVNRVYNNIQEIESLVSEISDQLIDVNAYIKTGLLYYGEDGAPVYGVEIGQQTSNDGAVVFKKFARLTAGKLSFYDENDTEVAYISDYRLHITTADIQDLEASRAVLGQLRMGDYTWTLGTDGHYSLT